MADYTIKAYLQMQAKNKQGLVPVYMRYYYGGVQSAYRLGESVKERHWNGTGQGSFRANTPEAEVKNAKLQLYINLLDWAAAKFEEPHWKLVKPEFVRALYESTLWAAGDVEYRDRRKEKGQRLSAGIEEEIRAREEDLDRLGLQQKILGWTYADVLLPSTPGVLAEGMPVDEAAYQLFHEQAKLYIKQFRRVDASTGKYKGGKRNVFFQGGSEMALDMDVPAHVWYKVLLDFEAHTGYRCTFAAIDRSFYTVYSDYLWDVKGYEDSSHFNHVSRLRMFLSDSISLGIQVNLFYKHRSFKLYKNTKPILALTAPELDELWHMDFAKEKLSQVRNMFCFQAFTGLRYSDLQKENEVQNERVVGKTQKTAGNYSIPLRLYPDNRLAELLTGNLRLGRNAYRDGIKEMMREFFTKRGAGERTVDVHFYQRGVLRRQADGSLPREPIWEAFSSHNARKTFCTITFHRGYSVEAVGKMIGSKRLDVLRENYISFIDSDLDRVIKDADDEQTLREKLRQQDEQLIEQNKDLIELRKLLARRAS